MTVEYLDDKMAAEKNMIPLDIISASVRNPEDPKSGHWKVDPGKHLFQTEFQFEKLKNDSRIHYIWIHTHPYSEFIELYDKTAKNSIWSGKIQNLEGKAFIFKADYYSSQKGLILKKDHLYEVRVVYNNTTSNAIDAMASLWLYYVGVK